MRKKLTASTFVLLVIATIGTAADQVVGRATDTYTGSSAFNLATNGGIQFAIGNAGVNMDVLYDEAGAIGRRYRRQDEVGTPFCLTVDGQTMEDGTVTVRDRDTLSQERVASERVREFLAAKLEG